MMAAINVVVMHGTYWAGLLDNTARDAKRVFPGPVNCMQKRIHFVEEEHDQK